MKMIFFVMLYFYKNHILHRSLLQRCKIWYKNLKLPQYNYRTIFRHWQANQSRFQLYCMWIEEEYPFCSSFLIEIETFYSTQESHGMMGLSLNEYLLYKWNYSRAWYDDGLNERRVGNEEYSENGSNAEVSCWMKKRNCDLMMWLGKCGSVFVV